MSDKFPYYRPALLKEIINIRQNEFHQKSEIMVEQGVTKPRLPKIPRDDQLPELLVWYLNALAEFENARRAHSNRQLPGIFSVFRQKEEEGRKLQDVLNRAEIRGASPYPQNKIDGWLTQDAKILIIEVWLYEANQFLQEKTRERRREIINILTDLKNFGIDRGEERQIVEERDPVAFNDIYRRLSIELDKLKEQEAEKFTVLKQRPMTMTEQAESERKLKSIYRRYPDLEPITFRSLFKSRAERDSYINELRAELEFFEEQNIS